MSFLGYIRRRRYRPSARQCHWVDIVSDVLLDVVQVGGTSLFGVSIELSAESISESSGGRAEGRDYKVSECEDILAIPNEEGDNLSKVWDCLLKPIEDGDTLLFVVKLRLLLVSEAAVTEAS